MQHNNSCCQPHTELQKRGGAVHLRTTAINFLLLTRKTIKKMFSAMAYNPRFVSLFSL